MDIRLEPHTQIFLSLTCQIKLVLENSLDRVLGYICFYKKWMYVTSRSEKETFCGGNGIPSALFFATMSKVIWILNLFIVSIVH